MFNKASDHRASIKANGSRTKQKKLQALSETMDRKINDFK
jgi:hypothetical protein